MKPIIYLEYKAEPDFSEQEIELKPILGGTFNRWNIALNPVLYLEREGADAPWELKPHYAVAFGRIFSKMFGLGLETTGGEKANYIGPVLTHGREDLWVSLGTGFKIGEIDEGEPEFKVRLLMGIGVARTGRR